MTVRHATAEDRLAVVSLLKRSHQAAGFTFPFQAARADALFDLHVARGFACCLLLGAGRPVGLLMATAFDHPFGAGLWAKETVWYIAPSARGSGFARMLEAYEAWAKRLGCVTIGMASLASNDVSRIYERRGYEPAETHFIKSL